MMKSYKRILCISDLHYPYQHPDTVKFLTAVKKKYNPDIVVSVGDSIDNHALSFHDSDADLPSAGDELRRTIKLLQPLYRLFPKLIEVDSNHSSMALRKFKHHGIPLKYLKSIGEVLEAPKGWKWVNDLKLKMSNGQVVYINHGMSKDGLKVAKEMGMSYVSGHYHTEFNIKYTSSPSQLYWSMQVGCSIDKKSLAFAYDKTNLSRPILGHGIILDGQPRLLPMILDKRGRWNGKLV